MQDDSIYAKPPSVPKIEDCYFYHTMDIPGHGLVQGEWDLRGSVQQYLGGLDFLGKRVLEMGTASGYLCLEMEKAGAEVVCFDLSEAHDWDIVPFARFGRDRLQAHMAARRTRIRQLNNAYWFAHHAHGSKAKMVYGSVYAVPEGIGHVDIATFTSILLHVRDPFLALWNALRLTRESVVITEVARDSRLVSVLIRRLGLPSMSFLPNHRTCDPMETWWSLSPDVLRRFIRVLGFERTHTTYFKVPTAVGKRLLFTIVGQRTVPIEACLDESAPMTSSSP
jgi:SAM-dependent methyltransferase